MTDLVTEMSLAWREKYLKAETTLQIARDAPALFKKQYVTELIEEAGKAYKHFNYWKAQS